MNRLLEWDSGHWGVRVARADSPVIHGWAAANGVACAYLLLPSDAPDLTHIAEREGWLFMDVRVELQVTAPVPSEEQLWVVEPHEPGDVDALGAIARVAHRHSRFYADPRFPDSLCDDLYDTWIRRSCEGWADAVLVVRNVYGRQLGYVTLHAEGGEARISLLGVADGYQGRGVGSALVNAALAWAHAREASRLTVVTQGRNVPAQRLYQRAGFVTSDVRLWFHRWFQ